MINRIKFRSSTRWLAVIVWTSFSSALLWAVMVPLWHFPDEQAHFAQVQNYAELGRSPETNNDLSFEIYESERLLGTLRNNLGRNEFTYHPEFKIEYTDTLMGKDEGYLKSLPVSTRTDFIKQESPRYPPLYYYWVALGYRFGYQGDLFTRVLFTRLASIALFVTLVTGGWFMAREVFPNQPWRWASLGIILSFHPMLSFVSSGINNDVLMNLLGTFLSLTMMVVLRRGVNFKRILALLGLVVAGIFTKQLIYLLIPPVAMILAWSLMSTRQKQGKGILFLAVLAILIFTFRLSLISFMRRGGFWLPFWPEVSPASPGYSLSFKILLSQRISQLYRETLVWYWGVYKWLGVVLSLSTIRLIKVAILASLAGWISYWAQIIKRRRLSVTDRQLLVLILTNGFYLLGLVVWDIFLTRSMGFAHGLQGRYFFPLIASQMLLLLAGWFWLLERWFSPQKIFLLIGGSFLILFLIAFWRVMESYYQLVPFITFIRQVSQYKPGFAKWPYLVVYWVLFIISLGGIFYTSVKFRKGNK